MAPRLIEERRCPHCGAELPEPKPRVCPECMGSLQQRYLRAGCLSSKPVALLAALGLWQALGGGGRAEEPDEASAPRARQEAPAAPALEDRGDRQARGG